MELYHAFVRTMDPALPVYSGVLVEDGYILRTGDFAVLRATHPDARVEDWDGAALLPGFIDGHSHLSAVAWDRLLWDARPSPEGVCDNPAALREIGQEYLRTHTLPHDTWMLGFGCDSARLGRLPTREDLDKISGQIPILLTAESGEWSVANSQALRLLGYDRPEEAPSPLPAALLAEPAISARVKGPGRAQLLLAVADAARLYASFGVTTMQDARSTAAELSLLAEAGHQGLIGGEVACYLDEKTAPDHLPCQPPAQNPYHDRCRMAGIKLTLDGAVHKKTAWLSHPYQSPPAGQGPDYRGAPLREDGEITELLAHCIRCHWQPVIHADGDAAIDQLLRCWQAARTETGSREELRPVAVHAQTVRRDQLEQMAELGILASFSHDPVYYWGDYHVHSVLGAQRAASLSPLAWALEAGVGFTLHQNAPAAPPHTLFSIQNAAVRRTRSGRPLGPEQTVPVQAALEAVTIQAARQLFEEGRKGSITPGKLADFTLLEADPLAVSPDRIADIRVLATVKAGRFIYRT